MTPPGWSRLDPRTLAVRAGKLLASMSWFFLFVVVFGSRDGGIGIVTLAFVTIGISIAVSAEAVRYLRTAYRIGPDLVELRTGLLSRRHLTVPRERIRRVELTAGPLHRMLGLSAVTVGTGEHTAGDSELLVLDAIAAPVASDLRTELLGTPATGSLDTASAPAPPAPGAPRTPPVQATVAPAPAEQIERFNWRWAPYDVLSYWTLLLPLMALVAIYELATRAGVDPTDPEVVGTGSSLLRSTPWWALAAVVLIGGLIVGVVGSLGSFIITWWGYELVREPGDRIRMQRGLFTTRSTTLDEHRLRGAEYVESLPLRLLGAGRVRVIAHGLSSDESVTADRADALLPPVPRPTAERVTGRVLRASNPPTAAQLRPHPPAARQRRLVRAAAATVAVAALAVVAVANGAPVLLGVVTVPVIGAAAAGYALDAARSLGHAVDGRFLVSRVGSFNRRTAALQRSGIIGWTVTQTFFQRRRGLATLTATTAAGQGAYSVVDLDASAAAALADDALPGLLTPLLTEPAESRGPAPASFAP